MAVVYSAPFGAETCINPPCIVSWYPGIVCVAILCFLSSKQDVFLLFACELSPNPLFDSVSNAASRKCIVISKYHAMIWNCENRRSQTRRNAFQQLTSRRPQDSPLKGGSFLRWEMTGDRKLFQKGFATPIWLTKLISWYIMFRNLLHRLSIHSTSIYIINLHVAGWRCNGEYLTSDLALPRSWVQSWMRCWSLVWLEMVFSEAGKPPGCVMKNAKWENQRELGYSLDPPPPTQQQW